MVQIWITPGMERFASAYIDALGCIRTGWTMYCLAAVGGELVGCVGVCAMIYGFYH